MLGREKGKFTGRKWTEGALGLGAGLLVVHSECLELVCFTGLWVLRLEPRAACTSGTQPTN